LPGGIALPPSYDFFPQNFIFNVDGGANLSHVHKQANWFVHEFEFPQQVPSRWFFL
jgi:hypothetical protein